MANGDKPRTSAQNLSEICIMERGLKSFFGEGLRFIEVSRRRMAISQLLKK
jgi:hypothetical protein